jgi:hypothetical protein
MLYENKVQANFVHRMNGLSSNIVDAKVSMKQQVQMIYIAAKLKNNSTTQSLVIPDRIVVVNIML